MSYMLAYHFIYQHMFDMLVYMKNLVNGILAMAYQA